MLDTTATAEHPEIKFDKIELIASRGYIDSKPSCRVKEFHLIIRGIATILIRGN